MMLKINKKYSLKNKKVLSTGGSLLLFGVIVGLLFKFLSSPAEAAWFDDLWNYRTILTIGNSGSAVSNQKVKLDIDTATLITAGKMQADCGDSRFTDVGGNLLDYYLDSAGGACNGASTDYYVLVPNIPSGNSLLYHYYGNPTASNGTVPTQFSQTTFSPTSGPTAGSEEVGGGPIAFWHMDEGTGQAVNDSTARNNAATLGVDASVASDDPTWITEDQCIAGKCLRFDGTNDVVKTNSNISTQLASSTTFATWIKTTDTTATLIGNFNLAVAAGPALEITGSKAYFHNGSAGNITGVSNVNDNKWHYIVATVTNSDAKLYVDGKQEASSSFSLIKTSTQNYLLGASYTASNPSNFFAGTMDEPKIYSYVRTLAQIKSDYNAGKAHASTDKGSAVSMGSNAQNSDALSNGLVGYWKMDDAASWSGTLAEVADSSGNGNNGQAGGATNGKAYQSVGKFNKAGVFDGVDDHVTLPTPYNPGTSDFTTAAWVNLNSADSASTKLQSIFGNEQNAPFFGYRPNTKTFQALNDVNTTESSATTNNLADSTWHHAAMTVDQTKRIVTFYLDGVLQSSRPLTGTYGGNSNQYLRKLGNSYLPGGSTQWHGLIDEARIYNRALSPAEVSQLYNWAPGPVGYWNFEEGQGATVADRSGSSNTGTWGGTGSHWTSGKYGKAGQFDGSSDYIDLGDLTQTESASQLTWSAWVNPTTTSGLRCIICKFNGDHTQISWSLQLYNSNTIIASVVNSINDASTYNVTTSTIPTSSWSHITAVFDGTQSGNNRLKIFVNGVLQPLTYNGTPPATTVASTASSRIGSTSDGLRFFVGKIDDAKIYNYARTPAQILQDMSTGVAEKKPVGYWKFDEGFGTTANDSSGNGNPLTLSTASWTNSGKFSKGWNGNGTNWLTRADDDDLDFGAGEDFSIAGWFKSDSATNPSGAEIIAIKTNHATVAGYAVGVNTNGTVYFGIDDDASFQPDDMATTTVDFYDGNWHYLVARKTGNTKIEIFIDGLLRASDVTIAATGSLANSNAFFLGDREGGNSGDEFNGDLDEFKIFRYALTPEEIKLEYNGGKSMVLGTNNTSVSTLVADTFNRSNGSLGTTDTKGLTWTGSTWTISSNGAVNTPTVGSELVTNGTFDTNTTGWTANNSGVLSSVAGGQSGNNLEIKNGAANQGAAYQNVSATANLWYQLNFYQKNGVGGAGYVLAGSTNAGTDYVSQTYLNNSSWTPKVFSYKATGAGNWIYIQTDASVLNNTVLFDELSVKPLTLSTLFSSIPTSSSDVTVSDAVTLTAGTSAGIVMNMDSTSSPANFVIAYHNGTQARLEKAVAGVYTTLISTNATYVAGAPIKVVKNGTSYDLYYNNTQVSTTQTITDSGIINNTIHGMFSTYSGNTIDNFSIQTNSVAQANCVPGESSNCGGPVGEWNFEEGTGITANDTSGNSNTGTLTNGPIWTTGKTGKGLQFDASDDGVYVTDVASLSPARFTISGWFKWDGVRYSSAASNEYGAIVSKGNYSSGEYTILFHRDSSLTDTSINLYINGSNQVSWSNSEIDTNWHYLTTTYNGSTAMIYLDGALKAQASVTPTVPDTSNSLILGRQTNSSYKWGGKLDGFKLFNYARTPAQIAWDYNQGEPVAHWKMDECQGTTINDSSGKGNVGTWNGSGGGSQTSAGTCTTASTAWGNGATGKYNSSLNFDGTDDYIDMGNPSTLNFGSNAYTTAAWIKTNTSARRTVLEKYTYNGGSNPEVGYYIDVLSTGKARFLVETSQSGYKYVDSLISVNDNQWHLVVGTWNGTTINMYVDGKLSNGALTTNGTITTTDSSNNFRIGYPSYSGSTYFQGQIDDARVYNYALTPTQVKTLYNQNSSIRFGPTTGTP